MKAAWMGDDIECLPREKLIEIIHELGNQLERSREVTQSIIHMNELARIARR